MRKRITFGLVAGFCIIATGCTSTGAAEEDAKVYCELPSNRFRMADEILSAVNDARLAEGLMPLVPDDSLADVAGEYACEMIEAEFFSHHSPETKQGPGDRLTKAGYIYFTMGENLAVGQTTATDVFDAWMASPRHRENILSPEWRETGIAVRVTPDGQYYWVQEFADPVKL